MQNFNQFCRAHPLLERLRLSKRSFHQDSLKRKHTINCNNHLIPMMKALSLHPQIIYYMDEFVHGGKVESTLLKLITDSSSLEELEICPEYEEKCDCNPNGWVNHLQNILISNLKLVNLKYFSFFNLCFAALPRNYIWKLTLLMD